MAKMAVFASVGYCRNVILLKILRSGKSTTKVVETLRGQMLVTTSALEYMFGENLLKVPKNGNLFMKFPLNGTPVGSRSQKVQFFLWVMQIYFFGEYKVVYCP